MFPQSPNFYVTRGRFAKDAENYSEAIEDFEFAEARLPANLSLLENMLECYEKIGDQEKVTEYSGKIEEQETEELKNEISTGFSPTRIEVNEDDDDEK